MGYKRNSSNECLQCLILQRHNSKVVISPTYFRNEDWLKAVFHLIVHVSGHTHKLPDTPRTTVSNIGCARCGHTPGSHLSNLESHIDQPDQKIKILLFIINKKDKDLSFD